MQPNIQPGDLSYQYKVWLFNCESKKPYGSLDNRSLLQSYHNAMVICGYIIDKDQLYEIAKSTNDSQIFRSPVHNDPYFRMWSEVGGIFKICNQIQKEVVQRFVLKGLQLKTQFTAKMSTDLIPIIKKRARTDERPSMDILLKHQDSHRSQLLYLYPSRYERFHRSFWHDLDTSKLSTDIYYSEAWHRIQDIMILNKQRNHQPEKKVKGNTVYVNVKPVNEV